MKITALVVAAALATTSAFAADTPALRALADGTEADAQLPADAPMEGADQQEWGGGWGRRGWGWGRRGWGCPVASVVTLLPPSYELACAVFSTG
ncbi:hypothetical protein C6341_g20472 [Phytophthora cactorum]|nr:hypothetical protein C6341_g20472 [Phytophthora cactorum]